MDDNTYNGWTGKGTRSSAYATWRVMLEYFDGRDLREVYDEKPTRNDLADALREELDDFIDEQAIENIYVRGWLDAFLDDVSFEEIAENMLSDWSE
jgi:hypothetical protein